MSRFEDPEPTTAHQASLVRGRMHAEMMSTSHAAERIEKLVEPRLEAVARAFPHLVGEPARKRLRVRVRSADAGPPRRVHRPALLARRDRVRRRHPHRALPAVGGFLAREIDLLFDAIRRSLSWLDAHPGQKPPAWEDIARRRRPAAPTAPAERRASASCRTPRRWRCCRRSSTSSTRSTSRRGARRRPRSAPRCATPRARSWSPRRRRRRRPPQLVGFAIGAPLERARDVEGRDDDPMLGKHNTMYSVSITVAPGFQSGGHRPPHQGAPARDARGAQDAPTARRATATSPAATASAAPRR